MLKTNNSNKIISNNYNKNNNNIDNNNLFLTLILFYKLYLILFHLLKKLFYQLHISHYLQTFINVPFISQYLSFNSNTYFSHTFTTNPFFFHSQIHP